MATESATASAGRIATEQRASVVGRIERSPAAIAKRTRKKDEGRAATAPWLTFPIQKTGSPPPGDSWRPCTKSAARRGRPRRPPRAPSRTRSAWGSPARPLYLKCASRTGYRGVGVGMGGCLPGAILPPVPPRPLSRNGATGRVRGPGARRAGRLPLPSRRSRRWPPRWMAAQSLIDKRIGNGRS